GTFEGEVPLDNGNVAIVHADLDDPANHDNRIHVTIDAGTATDGVQAGTWTFRLTGAGPWDAWIQRNSPAHFMDPHASPAKTVSIPGTHDAIISVGCFLNASHISRPGELSTFSGQGPTRDKRQAPTLAAPGEKIWAAMPAPALFGSIKGTSISAPLVTGTAALMLEINP